MGGRPPALSLLFETLALVVALGFAATLVPSVRVAGALVLLVAVVASFQVADRYWGTSTQLRRDRDARSALSAPAAALKPGTDNNFDTTFLAWVKGRLRPGERFYVVPGGPQGEGGAYQWSTYQLLPNISTAKPEDADVLVFYDADPATTDWDEQRFGPAAVFADGFAVARRSGK